MILGCYRTKGNRTVKPLVSPASVDRLKTVRRLKRLEAIIGPAFGSNRNLWLVLKQQILLRMIEALKLQAVY